MKNQLTPKQQITLGLFLLIVALCSLLIYKIDQIDQRSLHLEIEVELLQQDVDRLLELIP